MYKYHKIFNIGLNRAGTTSLTEAIGILGFVAIHHKYQGLRLDAIISHNIQRGQRPFYGIEQDYDMFSDFAGQHFFPLLDQCYPNSKFVVTTRELESWLDSYERKVNRNRNNPNYRHLEREIDRQKWKDDRTHFFQAVENYFRGRENDLLVIDIPSGEGWEKLCPFLGVEVPAIPFPWENRFINIMESFSKES